MPEERRGQYVEQALFGVKTGLLALQGKMRNRTIRAKLEDTDVDTSCIKVSEAYAHRPHIVLTRRRRAIIMKPNSATFQNVVRRHGDALRHAHCDHGDFRSYLTPSRNAASSTGLGMLDVDVPRPFVHRRSLANFLQSALRLSP